MTTDQESMALCAIRYCIGRQSYIVSSGVRWARDWGRRSSWVRGVLIQDLSEAVHRIERAKDLRYPWNALGGAQDEKEWREVLAELLAVQAQQDGGAAPTTAASSDVSRPAACRERLRAENKPYPKSGCQHCSASIKNGFHCPYQPQAKAGDG